VFPACAGMIRKKQDGLGWLGISKERVYGLAKKLKVASLLAPLAPDFILKRLPREQGVKKERKAEKIDWENSDAFAGNQGPIYILNENKKEEIKQKLENLTTSDGNKVAEAVYTLEELYHQRPDRYAPDLMLDQRKGVHTDAAIGSGPVFEDKDQWQAENKRTGLFLAYGPDFKRKGKLKTSILDLAPTILHLYGLPVPDQLQGKVLTDVFAPDSDAAQREVEYRKEQKEAAEELTGLDL